VLLNARVVDGAAVKRGRKAEGARNWRRREAIVVVVVEVEDVMVRDGAEVEVWNWNCHVN
jgi:hypothetical protein